MIKTFPQGRYPALEHLQIQQINHPHPGSPSPDDQIVVKRTSHNYCKDQFFPSLFGRLIPHQPPNYEANQIIAKYFTHSLNPIYEKIAGLPQEIFVCGFCKEPYYGTSQYLLHCLILECPVNHDRSTYFFHFKSKFGQIKNSDIYQTLTHDEWHLFKNISFRKRRFILARFNIKPLLKESAIFTICGKCKLKSKFHEGNLSASFIPHWVLYCRCPTLPTNSHSVTAIQRNQDLITFVDDVINLAINLNVITIFSDSYITLQSNPKYISKTTSTHFCANCKSHFKNQAYFLQHCLFQCKDKLNPKSSHIFKRKSVHKSYKSFNAKKFIEQQKTEPKEKIKPLKTINEKIEIEIDSKSSGTEPKPWNAKENPEFMEFKDLFNNIYFCGQCNNHFEDDENYLIHCLFSLCPLNQPRNTHFFYEKHIEETLSMKTVKMHVAKIDKKRLQKFKEDCQPEKKWKENLQVIDSSTKKVIRPGKNDDYHCGQCSQQFKKQQKFVVHCLNVCQSVNHEKSSHIIEYIKNKTIPDEEFKKFLISYLYAVQIMKFSPNKQYKITKNIYIDADPDYLCGKCDTLFENLYEYVLHSLQVCQNFRNKYSSHFIGHGVINAESERVRWPLDVLSCDNMTKNTWIRTNSNDLRQQHQDNYEKSQPLEIQQSQPYVHAKKDEFPQEKSEVKITQKEEIKPINITESVKKDQEISKFPRILRPNIEFKADKKEYYCGSCRIFERNEQQFISHLEECRSFQNKTSSHFFITNNQFYKMNITRVLLSINYKPYPKLVPAMKPFADNTFKCQCGTQGPLKNFAIHNRNKHNSDVLKGSSHVILRLVFFPCNDQVESVYLPVDPKGINLELEFACPCDPWKKYKYLEFINHIVKRHQGKTPKFWMRFDGEK